MKITKREFVTLETGTYPATVASLIETEGKFGPQLQWEFALEGDSTIRGWCSTSLSTKSTLYKWTRSLLGSVPDELDTDTLAGMPCRLSVVVKTHDDGSEYNRVENVLPPRASAKRVPVPVVAEEEEIPF